MEYELKGHSNKKYRSLCTVFINDTYYVFENPEWQSFHHIYDRDTNSFSTVQIFEGVQDHFIAYSKIRQKIYAIMLHGEDFKAFLWIFDVKKQEWTQVKSLAGIDVDAFAITNDEKYALILGYTTDYIMDLDSLEIKIGKWRHKDDRLNGGGFDIVCCSEYDFMSMKSLIYGYLREYIESDDIPNDIVQVIKLFMDFEQEIHLISLCQHVFGTLRQ